MDLVNKDDIDTCINKLTSFLSKTFKLASSKVPSSSSAAFPLDSVERAHILRLIQLRNRFHRKYQRTGCTCFKFLRNILNNTIHNDFTRFSKLHWSRYVSSLSFRDGSVWRFLKCRRQKSRPSTPFLHQGEYIYLPNEKAQCLADSSQFHLAPTYMPSPYTEIVDDFKTGLARMIPLPRDNLFHFFSPKFIYEVIRSFSNNKSPGPDKITVKMLKHCSRIIILQIYYITSNFIRIPYFPDTWKRANVIAIPKPGGLRESPTDFRPLSLLSNFGKIFERVILLFLRNFLDEREVIIREQFSFRGGHSTTLQLLRVAEFVSLEINKRREVAMVLLDLKKAFDSVWHAGLLYKLASIGLSPRILLFLSSYLNDRVARVLYMREFSLEFKLPAGVPQGSILGPLLFNIFINDVPRADNVSTAIYADDTALFSSSGRRRILISRMQFHIDKVVKFFLDWKLNINPDKSETILFFRRLNKQSMPSITVLGAPLIWT